MTGSRRRPRSSSTESGHTARRSTVRPTPSRMRTTERESRYGVPRQGVDDQCHVPARRRLTREAARSRDAPPHRRGDVHERKVIGSTPTPGWRGARSQRATWSRRTAPGGGRCSNRAPSTTPTGRQGRRAPAIGVPTKRHTGHVGHHEPISRGTDPEPQVGVLTALQLGPEPSDASEDIGACHRTGRDERCPVPHRGDRDVRTAARRGSPGSVLELSVDIDVDPVAVGACHVLSCGRHEIGTFLQRPGEQQVVVVDETREHPSTRAIAALRALALTPDRGWVNTRNRESAAAKRCATSSERSVEPSSTTMHSQDTPSCNWMLRSVAGSS